MGLFLPTLFLFSFSLFLALMVEALLECMRGRRRVHFSDVESPRGHDDEMISFGCRYRSPSSSAFPKTARHGCARARLVG